MKKTKLTFISSIPPVAAAVYGIITAKYGMALNSAFTVVCLWTFYFADKKCKFFSGKIYISVLIFILLSVFSGRSLGLYKLVPYWDRTLHFLSGFIIVISGKILFHKLNGKTEQKCLMKVFSFLTGVSAAGLWEIFEFSCDRLIGTAAQNNSLTDTMWDIILGTISAAVTVFFV